jgi:low temperature requirement protein LtrA
MRLDIRRRGAEHARGAATLELFYDLVFVFAVTQISHYLLEHLSWEGAGQSLLILMVVWWAWNFTTWVTNELDPESVVVRGLVIALMLATLLMAVAIPSAFGDRALLFAGSYVAIQVGRHLFLTFAAARPGTIERERALHILIWFSASGVLWIAGALADGESRTALWLTALAIDYGGPLVTFWVPGRRRVDPEAWEVESEHFAERFRLFVIIALGESVVLIGSTTAGLELDAAVVGALALAFVSTAALWWLYFTSIASLAEQGLEGSDKRTLVARDVFTYLHALLIAGIVVAAVGFELVIAHPTESLPAYEVAVIVAGPAIYLAAQLAMRVRMSGTLSTRRLSGIAALAVAGVALASAPALAIDGAVLAILATLVAADQIALRRREREGRAHPVEEAARTGEA